MKASESRLGGDQAGPEASATAEEAHEEIALERESQEIQPMTEDLLDASTPNEDMSSESIEAAVPEPDTDIRGAADAPVRPPPRAAAPAPVRRGTLIGMPAIVPGQLDDDPKWAPQAPFEVDGRFHLAHELALGPYGVTYAGLEIARGGPEVAKATSGAVHVTLFHPAFFRGSKKDAQVNRVRRALSYQSRYIAPTYAVGEAFGTVWAATAPTIGVPLTHWRRDNSAITAEEVYRIVGQLLDGIEAIHAAGGIHGSLSPETLRIVNGRMWVTSPWWLEPSDAPAHELQPLRMAWLAPEVQFGEHVNTAATDIFGIGMTLGYLLACGMTEPGHSLLVQGIDVPPAVDDVYVSSTARSKESRYQDIAGFRTALEVAAGFEWREAQSSSPAGAEGAAAAAAGVAAARPLMRPLTRPRVAPARPEPVEGLDELEPDLPEMPPVVDTASVLASVPGRETAMSELDKTWEDDHVPAFEDLGGGANLDLQAPARATEPNLAGPGSAAVAGLGPDPEATAVLTRPQVKSGGPSSPSSRRLPRVQARTLALGEPRARSGMTPPPQARPSVTTGRPELPPAPEFDPTDGLPGGALTDEIFRELTEGTDLRPPASEPAPEGAPAPPPLPSVTRPRWRSSWGSSLESLDVGGPALPPLSVKRGAVTADGEGDEETVEASRKDFAARLVPAAAVAAAAASDATVQTQAIGDDDFPGALEPAKKPMESAEPTIVEGIAPALLEVDVFNADGMPPPQVDLFAPPVEAKNPWSDSPLQPSPGASNFDHLPKPEDPISTPRQTSQAPPPPLPPGAGSQALEEPRVLRNPSGPLAGASATLSAIPIRAEGAPASLATSTVIPSYTAPKRRPMALWWGLGALGIGVLAALIVIVATSGGEPEGAEGARLASVNGSTPGGEPGEGGDPLATPPLVGEATTRTGGGDDGDGPGGATQPGGNGGSGAAPVAVVVAGGEDDAKDAGESDGEAGDVALAAAIEDGGGADGADGGDDVAVAAADTAGDTGGPSDAGVQAAAADGGTGDDAGDGASAAAAVAVAGGEATTGAGVEEDAPGDPETDDPKGSDPNEADPGQRDPKAGEDPDAKPVEVTASAKPADKPAEEPVEPEKVEFVPKDPKKFKCPAGMARLAKKITVKLDDGSEVKDWDATCIDRFEYPGAGAVPRTNIDLAGAKSACAAKGKRLCSRGEWRRACGYTAYPYGRDYEAGRCNTAGDDGSPRALVGAGSKKGCMSRSGVFDMVGNAAEWTSDGSINGGTSFRNAADAKCGSRSKRVGGAPHIGFRCCEDAADHN